VCVARGWQCISFVLYAVVHMNVLVIIHAVLLYCNASLIYCQACINSMHVSSLCFAFAQNLTMLTSMGLLCVRVTVSTCVDLRITGQC